jgi:hypothetical protein
MGSGQALGQRDPQAVWVVACALSLAAFGIRHRQAHFQQVVATLRKSLSPSFLRIFLAFAAFFYNSRYVFVTDGTPTDPLRITQRIGVSSS